MHHTDRNLKGLHIKDSLTFGPVPLLYWANYWSCAHYAKFLNYKGNCPFKQNAVVIDGNSPSDAIVALLCSLSS